MGTEKRGSNKGGSQGSRGATPVIHNHTNTHTHTHQRTHENTRNTQGCFLHGPSIASLIFTVPSAPFFAEMVVVVDVDVMPAIANDGAQAATCKAHRQHSTTQCSIQMEQHGSDSVALPCTTLLIEVEVERRVRPGV